MGAALNASFRANASSLQSLFCDLGDEPAVVRACSEWFALCLVLLLDPSREETRPAPMLPSQQYDRRLFSPAPSASTAPITPASHAASIPTTPASTSTSPTTPVSGSGGGISVSGDGPTPDNNSSSRGRSGGGSGMLLHHGQFSRATILGVGSLVLARRLARTGGPCLPIQVQQALGLQDDNALDIVAVGVRLARKAFETQTPPPDDGDEEDDEEEEHSRNRGQSILAGVAIFERDVVSSGTTRTLLEWVTDSGEGGAMPTTPDGRLGEAGSGGANDWQSSPPDFIQGTTLCAAADGNSVSFPSEGGSPSKNQSQAEGLGSICGSGGCGSPSSTGSDTDSDVSMCRRRAGRRALSFSGRDDSTSGLKARTRSPTTRTEADERGSRVPSSSKASSVAMGEREKTSSGGGEGSVAVTGKGFSASPSCFVASQATLQATLLLLPPPPFLAPRNDANDAMESGNAWSCSSSPADRAGSSGSPARSFHSSCAVSASHGSGESTSSCDDEPRTPRRPASGQADGDRSSREGWSAAEHKGRRSTAHDETTPALPRRREAGGTTAASTSSPAQDEQKNARWEVLMDRLLAALEDHCGCSFCELYDGGGDDNGGSAVRESSDIQSPSPPTPSPPSPLYDPPLEPLNDNVVREKSTSPAPRLPPYPAFTPPGAPAATPLGGSSSFHGLSSSERGGAPSSFPCPAEEAPSDGRRSVAGLDLADRERPGAAGQRGRGTKRPWVAAADGEAGDGAPYLKLSTAAMGARAASSTGAAASENAASEEGRQNWWW